MSMGTETASVYRPTAEDIRRANEVRERIRRNVEEQLKADRDTEGRMMAIGRDAMLVRDRKMWLLFRSRKTRKPFHSFHHWLSEDCMGLGRSTVYDAILASQYLVPLPAKTLEELGKSKCYELARVKRDMPSEFKPLMKAVMARPELSVRDVQTMVTSALAGQSYNSGGWERMEIALRAADMAVVRQALIVAGVEHPVKQPDTPFAVGAQLKAICEEYLSGEEQRSIWKKLDKAGAFTGSRFKLEEE